MNPRKTGSSDLQMQMQDACVYELSAHISHQTFSDLAHLNVITLDGFQCLCPVTRYFDLHPIGTTNKCRMSLNGHDTRDNWNVNSLCTYPAHPVQKDVGIVEHLSNDECST